MRDWSKRLFDGAEPGAEVYVPPQVTSHVETAKGTDTRLMGASDYLRRAGFVPGTEANKWVKPSPAAPPAEATKTAPDPKVEAAPAARMFDVQYVSKDGMRGNGARVEAKTAEEAASMVESDGSTVTQVDGKKWKGRTVTGQEPLASPVKVEATPEGKTVSVPAKDKPGIPPKEQKKFLIAEVDRAIAEAPEDNSGGKITIEVPGDGTYTVFNMKSALEAFRKVASKFPSSMPKPETPARSTAAGDVPSAADKAIDLYGEAGKAAKTIRAQVERMAPTEDKDADQKNIDRWLKIASELEDRAQTTSVPADQKSDRIKKVRALV
jgi:hypothetical protein